MIASITRRFFGDRRANVAMMYALSLPVLAVGVGCAVDYTHAMQVQAELNAAADAAVLAALTPSMMQQPDTVAAAAALNMFNGQIAHINSIAAGTLVVVAPTITHPASKPLQRIVSLTYTAQNNNIFASILGYRTLQLKGGSTANASLAANINFYLLLDNSPSMALPATQAGITQMIGLTPIQDYEGGAYQACAFACHQASTGNSDTQGNLCLKGTTYTRPTVNSGSPNNTPNSYCSSTQGTQIDNFALSRLNGIQLRLDALSAGISDLMSDAATAQQNAAATPPIYKFAAYTMDSSWQIGMSSSNSYNQLMALTTSYVSGWTSAAPNFAVMQYYANNEVCNSSACTSNGGGGDYATNFDNALSSMNTIMPAPGTGTNIAGDTPQEVLFFVTDGVEDEMSGSNRLIQLIDGSSGTNYCTTIKNRGIRIAILYTDYFPVLSNSFYVSNVKPFQANIGTSLQTCASPGLFYDAGIGSDLGAALQTLFNSVTSAAHLTN